MLLICNLDGHAPDGRVPDSSHHIVMDNQALSDQLKRSIELAHVVCTTSVYSQVPHSPQYLRYQQIRSYPLCIQLQLLCNDINAEHVDVEHIDAEHVGTEHINAEHVGTEHIDEHVDEHNA